MTRVQGGGGVSGGVSDGGGGGSDVFGQVPQIPIQRMVGGNGSKEDDIVTEAVIAHIIATVMLDEEKKEPPAPAPPPDPKKQQLPAPEPVMIENKKPLILAPITPRLSPNVEPVPERVPDSFNPPTPKPAAEEPPPLEPLPFEFEPVRNLKGTGKQTKLLWNYSGKNRIRVRTNLTDAEIKAFLTLNPKDFQLDERALFDSLFFSEDDVRKYLVDHQDGFVSFWRRFIEYDGTNPLILYTTKEGRFFQDFLKNIANVRLKKLLLNVAYLLPPHKRPAYIDPGDLIRKKSDTQATAKPHSDFLPTVVEKTKLSQEEYDALIKPIEARVTMIDSTSVTEKITIDNFNNAREFVKAYEQLQTDDLLKLTGQKTVLEGYQKENETKLEAFTLVIQKLSDASTQDRDYITRLTTQKEALEQINTGYTLYMSDIDKLVERTNKILDLKKTLHTTLKGKLEKMFKASPAPAAAAGAPAAAAGAPAAAAQETLPGQTRVMLASLNVLKGNVSKSANPGEIITKVLVIFFNGKIWSTYRIICGKKGFFTNILIDNRKNKNTNYISKDKTTFQSLKDDTAEDNLWKYLDKLLFLEEYTPEQIEEIKTHLNKFIVEQEDRDKMAKLYKYIYNTGQTGVNQRTAPKRVTLRKSKIQKQA